MKPRDRDDDGPRGLPPLDETASSADDARPFLSSLPTFASLDEQVLELLRARMTEKSFAAGQVLMTQGEPGTTLVIVSEGEVDVSVEEGGSRHLLKRVRAGEILGEMALLTQEPRSAHVVAVTPGRAWVLPAVEFHELAREHPNISVVLTRLVASRLGRHEHDALSGKIFHGHRIRRRLGRGGMSVVYEAEDPEGRRVALKMMSHRLLYDPAGRERFQREAEIVESFDHPSIARMYGRFEAFRTAFIVMEFCEGVAVDDVIRRRGPLPEDAVRKIFGQLASAVTYAHDAGIIHRDIKPSNVMITRDGSVKLMDFGLAGRIADLSSEGSLIGTPRYMAPEQMARDPVGREVDLFALGLVTYEMLAGKSLFRGKSFWALRREIVRCEIPDLAVRLPGIGEEMRETVAALLAKKPADRVLDLDRARSWAGSIDLDALVPDRTGP